MATSTSKRWRSTSPAPSLHKRVRTEESSTRTKFLVLSDTHGADIPSDLPHCDVVLHYGDLTEDGSPKAIAQAFQALSKADAELKLVIAGNHEISMDKAFYLVGGGNEADVEEASALKRPAAESEASKCGVTFLSRKAHITIRFPQAPHSAHIPLHTPQSVVLQLSNTLPSKTASIHKTRPVGEEYRYRKLNHT
jgi:hypothetical protein